MFASQLWVFALCRPPNYKSTPRGTPWNFGRNRGGVIKKWLSAYKSSNISKTRQDRTRILSRSIKMSYTRFRLVRKTSDDRSVNADTSGAWAHSVGGNLESTSMYERSLNTFSFKRVLTLLETYNCSYTQNTVMKNIFAKKLQKRQHKISSSMLFSRRWKCLTVRRSSFWRNLPNFRCCRPSSEW